MKVMVACEFSGVVRDAFLERGHDAISCDLLPTEKPGPHIQGDIRDVEQSSGDNQRHSPSWRVQRMGWLRGPNDKSPCGQQGLPSHARSSVR